MSHTKQQPTQLLLISFIMWFCWTCLHHSRPLCIIAILPTDEAPACRLFCFIHKTTVPIGWLFNAFDATGIDFHSHQQLASKQIAMNLRTQKLIPIKSTPSTHWSNTHHFYGSINANHQPYSAHILRYRTLKYLSRAKIDTIAHSHTNRQCLAIFHWIGLSLF